MDTVAHYYVHEVTCATFRPVVKASEVDACFQVTISIRFRRELEHYFAVRLDGYRVSVSDPFDRPSTQLLFVKQRAHFIL